MENTTADDVTKEAKPKNTIKEELAPGGIRLGISLGIFNDKKNVMK
jgi:hypothetical protein